MIKLFTIQRIIPWWRRNLDDPGPKTEFEFKLIQINKFCLVEVSLRLASPCDEGEAWGGYVNIDLACFFSKSLLSLFAEVATERRLQNVFSVWLTLLDRVSAASLQLTLWRLVGQAAVFHDRFANALDADS